MNSPSCNCLWIAVLGIFLGTPLNSALAHDGPDPIAHWILNRKSIEQNRLQARLGPDGKFMGNFEVHEDPMGQSVMLAGQGSGIMLAENYTSAKNSLPAGPFTVSAWCSVNSRQKWGSIISLLQDNGGEESGWILGYSDKRFYFGLATTGANDGDGKMTYLSGETAFNTGQLYHVVGVFDGKQMELYVNGKLDGTSNEQHGSILYPKSAPLTLGLYLDDNERYSHHGLIRDVALYNLAAKPQWVEKEFRNNEKLASYRTTASEKQKLVVEPYLQMATQTSITVSWETAIPALGKVRVGEAAGEGEWVEGKPGKLVHHVDLTDLKPETQYFYEVQYQDENGKFLPGPAATFQTASRTETPYAFAIISDTQGNPKVSGKIAEMAWAQRPNFLVHPGDLVSTGTDDSHWTQHFFASMKPLISRVPFYPVLGNHEMNARNYYDYMKLPAPEYFYEFQYGNAHFFMLDSNKKLDSESEQYQWLDQALSKSTAQWKFAVHHHPPYSSDENDYGNLWKTNRSTRGDLRARQLTQLYDKHNVDIVFNGHIHSYERTWPIYEGKVTRPDRGTVYMITGGGGGGLETPGPFRPFFQNNVKTRAPFRHGSCQRRDA